MGQEVTPSCVGFVPTIMCLSNTINATRAANFNALFCLSKVCAVAVFCRTWMLERQCCFFVCQVVPEHTDSSADSVLWSK